MDRIKLLTVLSKKPTAVIPWYLTGGIATASCVAAYKAKGAADLAASYDNLTGNATYDITTAAAPDWDAINGWKFTGNTGKDYLNTAVVPADTTWSMVVRYAGHVASMTYANIATAQTTAGGVKTFGFGSYRPSTRYISNGGTKSIATGIWAAAGVIAICNRNFYVDGSLVANDIPAGTAPPVAIFIGAADLAGSVDVVTYIYANIQAVAIYSADISSNIAALTEAMAAL